MIAWARRNAMMQSLSAIPLLASLSSADLNGLNGAMQERAYRNRAVIFNENDSCTGLHIVKTGQVRLLRACKSKEQVLAVLLPGDLLDPLPLLDNGEHSATAIARGEVTTYLVACEAARALLQNQNALNVFLRAVGAQLRSTTALACDLAFKDVTARVCKVLLRQAEIDGERQRDGVHLKRAYTQNEFASLAGTAREVAWRSLKKLQGERLIRIERDQIVLLDVERLAALGSA